MDDTSVDSQLMVNSLRQRTPHALDAPQLVDARSDEALQPAEVRQ